MKTAFARYENSAFKPLSILTACAFALASGSAFADDDATKARQVEAQKNQDKIIKATQDPQGRNVGITKSADEAKAAAAKRDAEMAKMTPEQKAAAKKARQAKAQKNQDKIIKATQDPQGRNVGITKSADEAKAAEAKRDAEMAKMTPEQKAAAEKARQAKAQKDQDTIIKATQDPQGRNANIK
jgi:colicin import membrane protein